MKLSIIIPVYKVEQFLNQCIRSITDQIRDGIEIILVDDGSPDYCPQICDEWAEKFSCISVIHQQNQGLSMARNNGLEKAKGNYVWFVDSDDWLLPNAINDVFSVIEKYPDVDVFSSYMRRYYEQTERYKDIRSKYYGFNFSGKSYMKHHCPKGASQRFVYKRSFIDNNALRFYPGVLHEDGIWGNSMLYLAKKVHVLERPIYVYRLRNEGSIMSNIKVKSAYDLITGHKILVDFMNKNVAQTDRSFFRCQIFGMVVCAFSFCLHLSQTSEYKVFLCQNQSYISREGLNILSIRPYIILAWLMYINPSAVFRYMKAKNKMKAVIKNMLKFHE